LKRCYLLGHPVEHSMSGVMHNAAFINMGLDMEYILVPVLPGNLRRFMREDLCQEDVAGANVTIPHKVAVMSLLDEVEGEAKEIGAVNTIVNEGGYLKGYNTDGAGAAKALREAYGPLEGARVVLLGAGGAARALVYYLAREAESLVILNRDPLKAKLIADRAQGRGARVRWGGLDQIDVRDADILVNSTPVGMFPNSGASPVDPRCLHGGLLVFDLVYNPVKTRLLEDAERAGARTLSGVSMLVYQGAEAFKLWTGLGAPVEVMREAVLAELEASH
jgi:shikimate dehydrogenase